jgi:hypothetical protein
MNKKLRKMLEAHGVDIAVGNPDYWSSAIEMVMAEIYDEATVAEREACAKLCDDWPVGRDDICDVAKAIRARDKK